MHASILLEGSTPKNGMSATLQTVAMPPGHGQMSWEGGAGKHLYGGHAYQ